MPGTQLFNSVDDLAARIGDGEKIAIFKDGGVPMEAVRALVRRDARDLHLVTVPTGGIAIDLLIGAECVSVIETAGVSLGEFGPAPRFTDAVSTGRVKIMDSTCPAIYAGLQAAQKGIPFMPLRGLLGTDILANRPDYIVIDNPHGATGDPIVTLPALRPDVALLHVARADTFGNVWIGRQAELKIMAHAAARTYVTAEEVIDGNLLDDEFHGLNCLPAHYVDGIAPAKKGAWPMDMPGHYARDDAAIEEYRRQARSRETFGQYLRDRVLGSVAAAE